jgi:acetyl-CoA carboxylase beta subunit
MERAHGRLDRSSNVASLESLDFDPTDSGEEAEFDEFDLDLTCPTCGADLIEDEQFRVYRVCSACRRHFWIPVRERLGLLLDVGSFNESNEELVSLDPLVFHDRLPVADRLAEAREQPGISEAVVTGFATIGGEPIALVALDLAVIGSNIGILAGEKIALAMEAAIARRLPLVAICSGANARGFDGVLSLVQLARLSSLAGRLHLAGRPLIAIATHPTSGNVQLGFANQADFIFAEPGAHIGFEPSSRTGEPAEVLLARGEIDGLVERADLGEHLTALLNLLAKRGVTRPRPSEPIAAGDALPRWGDVRLVRRADRPQASDYVKTISPSFIELHGDRAGSDDEPALIGIGRIDGVAVAILAIDRDRGVLAAGAYRKASRLLKIATHLEMPVVSFIDPPSDPDGVAVATAGLALSSLLGHVAQAPVPLVSVVLGDVSGAASFPFAIADRLLMLEHAVLTVPQAETAASARDSLRWGIATEIVREPEGGAHVDPAAAAHQVEISVSNALAEISSMGPRRLLDERARRLRSLGMAGAEIRASVDVEIRELQEWQKLVSRSFEDLRQRWQANLPAFSGKPTMPHFSGKMSLPTISLPKFGFKKPDFSEFADRMAAARKATAARRAEPPAEKDAG